MDDKRTDMHKETMLQILTNDFVMANKFLKDGAYTFDNLILGMVLWN